MALVSGLKRSVCSDICFNSVIRRWTHALAVPFNSLFESSVTKPQSVVPENDFENEKNGIGIDLPSFGSGGSMELMAVPKKKTTPYKRGLRNGPKALKPVPVIVRCKACGRVKLPHFYCCSGIRENPNERSG